MGSFRYVVERYYDETTYAWDEWKLDSFSKKPFFEICDLLQ